jgi:hypothetical protein
MANKLFRISLLLILGLVIQGCGFKPVNSIEGFNLKEISIAKTECNGVSKGLGWEFNKMLEMELLNGSLAKVPKYALSTTLNATKESGIIQRDSTISRYNTKITLNYVLTDIASKEVLTKGKINLADSFDASHSTFSIYISDEASKRRLLQNLAHNLRHRLYIVQE